MSLWQKALGNVGTTLAGLLAASATYFAGVGGKLPTNSQEWTMAASSIALLALGVLSKDATTGSAPGAKN